MHWYCVASTFTFITLLVVIQSTNPSPMALSSSKKNYKFVTATNLPQIEHTPRQSKSRCRSLPINEESWNGHKQKIREEYFEPPKRVRMYADENAMFQVKRWVFDFTTNVWEYMTRTYGDFDLSQCLYVVLHSGRYAGGRIIYASNSNSTPADFNILDLGFNNSNAWKSEEPVMVEMDLITNYLAHFVEFSYMKRFGSASENIWKGSSNEHTAWVDIFTYDVYKSLNYTVNAELYRNISLLKSHKSNFPKNETFWFRDWLLPIYENFGGITVLNNYFTILGNDIPSSTKSLNIGEFVHSWSGTAGFDLTSLAKDAFGWNDDFQKMLTDARLELKKINKLYKITISEKSLTTTTSGETEDDNTIDTRSSIEITSTTTAKENDINSNTQVVIVASASASVICVIILTSILCIVFYKKKIRSLKTEIRSLTKKEVQEFFQGQDNVIGSGEYGCVIHGFVRQLDSGELLPVAIKTVKADVEVAQFKAMLSEAKIMAFLGKHDNIILLCGTYTGNIKNREIYIALELCTLGDLQNFLKNNAKDYKHTPLPAIHNEVTDGDITVSTLNLYQWSHNISNAMIYLTEKKVIHGDLAARNVLLTSNRVAKISDFGLSRQLLNCVQYLKTTKTPLPWRWMAVESLQDMEFSVASDVWAFGVTLWEIFSLGATPYPGWTWDYGFVNRLIRGDRLEAPAYADASTCDLMRTCWKLEPLERPSFQAIHNILGELVIKHSTTFSPNYVDLIPTEVQMDLECDSEILV